MPKLTIVQFCNLVNKHSELKLHEDDDKKVRSSFEFLKEYSSDKIIYGINTGFGPMAQFKINDDNLDKLQYNLIYRPELQVVYLLHKIYLHPCLLDVVAS